MSADFPSQPLILSFLDKISLVTCLTWNSGTLELCRPVWPGNHSSLPVSAF